MSEDVMTGDNDLCECGHIRRVHLDGSGRCCHCRCDRFNAEMLRREGDMSEEVRAAAERLRKLIEADTFFNDPIEDVYQDVLCFREKTKAAIADCMTVARAYLAAADRLRWTSEAPTVPGWYWTRGVTPFGRGPELMRAFQPAWIDPDRKDLEFCYPDGSGEIKPDHGEWAGPLTPPEMTHE